MRALEAGRVLSSALRRHMGPDQLGRAACRRVGSGPRAQEEPGGVARGPPTLRLEESLCNKGLRDGSGPQCGGKKKQNRQSTSWRQANLGAKLALLSLVF